VVKGESLTWNIKTVVGITVFLVSASTAYIGWLRSELVEIKLNIRYHYNDQQEFKTDIKKQVKLACAETHQLAMVVNDNSKDVKSIKSFLHKQGFYSSIKQRTITTHGESNDTKKGYISTSGNNGYSSKLYSD